MSDGIPLLGQPEYVCPKGHRMPGAFGLTLWVQDATGQRRPVYQTPQWCVRCIEEVFGTLGIGVTQLLKPGERYNRKAGRRKEG